MLLEADIGVALFVLALQVYRRLSGAYGEWRTFWLGALIGLSWELGFYATGPRFEANPSYEILSPFPIHPFLQPLTHAVWDGALFLVGIALVRASCTPPLLARFRWQELLVLVAWGNTQEFVVEVFATTAGLWTFLPKPYNPTLFRMGMGQITLLPQIIWTAAPLGFYGAMLWLRRNDLLSDFLK